MYKLAFKKKTAVLSQQGRCWQSADRLTIKTCLTNSNGITTIQ